MKPQLFISLLIALTACNRNFYAVLPSIETTPVQSREDAADDAAIFISNNENHQSLIIGTDKQHGLVVYNTQGNIVK